MENKIIFLKSVSSEERKSVLDFVDLWKSESKTISLLTSGSTGSPKKIQIEKSAMIASARATGKFFNFEENKKMLLCLSAKYIAGMMQIVRAHVFEMPLFVAPVSSNPLREFSEEVDFAAFVPLQVQAILADEVTKQKYESIKHVIIGGAPISSNLFHKVSRLKNKSFATFGMTETVSHVALKQITKGNEFYQALPEISFSKSKNGALIINAKKIDDNPIVTNDIVELINNSSFKWLGRADFVINSGGIKLHPEVIEEKLANVIKDHFYITKKRDDKLGEKVVLVIESPIYLPAEKKTLDSIFRKILTSFEIPKLIVFQSEFNRTATGKIIRDRLIQ